jgi:magnesium-transporting ATPase (P-type)
MGERGTDVARAAATLVLLDDDFATIVAAIEQGRSTFSNIRRFLTYHLTDNVAELAPFVVWALSGGRFPLAIGVLQILALDVGTDIGPALALGAEPPGTHVLEQPPTQRHLMDRGLLVRAFAWLGPTEALVSLTAFVVSFVAAGWSPGEAFPEGDTLLAASGAAFTAVVLGQVANAFACRSTRLPVWQISLWRNRLLLWAIAIEVLMLIAFLFFEPLASILDQAPPSWAGFGVAALAIPAVVLVDAIQKRVLTRRFRR